MKPSSFSVTETTSSDPLPETIWIRHQKQPRESETRKSGNDSRPSREEGYLSKWTEKAYGLRYFVLEEDRLTYYGLSKECILPKPRRTIGVSRALVPYYGRRHFRISTTSTNHEYDLLAESSTDRKRWLDALQRAGAVVVGPSDYPVLGVSHHFDWIPQLHFPTVDGATAVVTHQKRRKAFDAILPGLASATVAVMHRVPGGVAKEIMVAALPEYRASRQQELERHRMAQEVGDVLEKASFEENRKKIAAKTTLIAKRLATIGDVEVPAKEKEKAARAIVDDCQKLLTRFRMDENCETCYMILAPYLNRFANLFSSAVGEVLRAVPYRAEFLERMSDRLVELLELYKEKSVKVRLNAIEEDGNTLKDHLYPERARRESSDPENTHFRHAYKRMLREIYEAYFDSRIQEVENRCRKFV